MKPVQPSDARLYLLNSPVLSDYGDWRLEGPITIEQAKVLVSGGFVSAVGHAATAELLSRLLGVDVPVRRVRAEMRPGDQALVFWLKQRLPEGSVLSANELANAPYELALLTRLA